MQNILWPFYKWPLSLTKLPSFTVRDIKRITPSYVVVIIWQTPQINRQPNKHPPPQAILPILYSYTQKEIDLLKTQGVGQHKGYWFLNTSTRTTN
jgi:hypothetical protein